MARFISLGKYYHKYKIMIIYLVTMTPFYYLFFSPACIRIPFLLDENFPLTIVVYEIFRYFGNFIFGIIFYKLELGNKLSGKGKNNLNEEANNKFKLILYDGEKQISKISILVMVLPLSIF